jgi:hypothetical protein
LKDTADDCWTNYVFPGPDKDGARKRNSSLREGKAGHTESHGLCFTAIKKRRVPFLDRGIRRKILDMAIIKTGKPPALLGDS